MKQLLVLSGKGGTGKTTIASALIKISEAKAQLLTGDIRNYFPRGENNHMSFSQTPP